MLPFLTKKGEKSPRLGFLYFDDDGDLVGLRYDNWKVVFMEQRIQITLRIWQEPFVPLRFPKLFNLRTDPFERADVTSNTYWDWIFDHLYLFVPAQGLVAQFLGNVQGIPTAPEEYEASSSRKLRSDSRPRRASAIASSSRMLSRCPIPWAIASHTVRPHRDRRPRT